MLQPRFCQQNILFNVKNKFNLKFSQPKAEWAYNFPQRYKRDLNFVHGGRNLKLFNRPFWRRLKNEFYYY